MNFPPKVPPSEWVDDPRNKKWAWAKPVGAPGAPAGPQPAAPLENAYETVLEIQDRERQRNGEKSNDIERFTGMVSAVKSILPQQTPPTDNTMLTTIVTLLTTQIQASQQEAQQLRTQVFELITKQSNQQPAGDNLESILMKAKTIIPELRSLFDIGGEKVAEIVHGRNRPWWQDMLTQFLPSLAPGMNSLMSAGAQALLTPRGTGIGLGAPPPQQQAALPAPANGQPQQQAPPDPLLPLKQRVGGFLGANLSAVQRYFEGYVKGTPSDPDDPDAGAMNGEDFAIWVSQGNPDILKDARSLGSANIIAMFQQTPAIWNAIAPNEAKFRQFLDQVLAFASDEEEDEKEEGPVNLTEEKVN